MKKNILFMLSGSIACFKACELISKLSRSGFVVKAAVTPSALHFIGESTLEGLSGNPIYKSSFESGKNMDHIYLARWADLILLCPATANTINQMSSGISNNIVTDIFLSNNFLKPFLIAPAMNTQMLFHPTTQESLKKLTSWGAFIFNTEEGELACKENGLGRLVSLDTIYEKICSYFNTQKTMDSVKRDKSFFTVSQNSEGHSLEFNNKSFHVSESNSDRESSDNLHNDKSRPHTLKETL